MPDNKVIKNLEDWACEGSSDAPAEGYGQVKMSDKKEQKCVCL